MHHKLSRYLSPATWRVLQTGPARRLIANAFHVSYYHSTDTWQLNRFLGYPILQCPLDLYTYQEVLDRVRPSFVLQTGVAHGGSLLYFATLLDLVGAPPSAVVIGIDIELTDSARSLAHPRIRLLEGSSTDPVIVRRARELLPAPGGLVVLDSDQSMQHVLSEMHLYKDLVDVGSFLVVEDTNVNGHPVSPGFGPGPHEAVQEFLASCTGFVQDDGVWKRQLLSFHQGGWLRRIR